MFRDFSKAFSQLSDPRLRSVIWLSLALTLGTYVALGLALWWGFSSTVLLSLPWADTMIDIFGTLAALLLSLFLFPAVVTLWMGLYLEDVADAVEERHYPTLPDPRQQQPVEALWVGVRLGLVALLANLLVLPLYFIPVVNLFVFYGVNGYLLGREYFEMVALRRFSDAEVKALRQKYSPLLWTMGAVITFLLSVPILNILAPLVGVAAMTHLTVRLGLFQDHPTV